METNQYDNIASLLKEAQRRFGDDTFRNTRRLKGLLADHLFDKVNEINIVISAIEDGVPDELNGTDPQSMDIAINRICEKLEANRGIRGDISRSAVMAIAYSMDLSDLPSSQVRSISKTSAAQQQMPPQPTVVAPEGGDDWVGLSEAVASPQPQAQPQQQQQQPQAPNPSQPQQAAAGDLMSKIKQIPQMWLGLGAAAVVAFLVFGGMNSTPQQQSGPQGGQQGGQGGQQGGQGGQQGGQGGQGGQQGGQGGQQGGQGGQQGGQGGQQGGQGGQQGGQGGQQGGQGGQQGGQGGQQGGQGGQQGGQGGQQGGQGGQQGGQGGQQGGQQTTQSFFLADDNGTVWQYSAADSDANTKTIGMRAQTQQGLLTMLLIMDTQNGGFTFSVIQNNQTIAEGVATATDQTHFSYNYSDTSGNRGNGRLHYNHMPS